MKRKNVCIVGCLLFILLISTTSLLAASDPVAESGTSDVHIPLVASTVRASEVTLQGEISGGRFLVPMRSIFEVLGASVDWNGETKTVTAKKGNISIMLSIDDKKALVNDEPLELDVPATIINGRTFVPTRFVSESLGASVSWDGEKRLATISLEGTVIKVYEEKQHMGPEPTYYTLTVEVDGAGNTTPTPGVHKYAVGTEVELTAIVDDPISSYFISWNVNDVIYSDSEITIVMDGNKTVTAQFGSSDCG